jgi:predicted Fe-Mo cluster-binding NifX family protein
MIGEKMILIISSFGKTLESSPNPRFGRTDFFIKFDTEKDDWEPLENPAVSQSGGAGIAASQFLANQNAAVAISGHFGPNAFRALSSAKIKMYTFKNSYETIEDVVDAYKQNSLDEV